MKRFSRNVLIFALIATVFVPTLLLLAGCPAFYESDGICYKIYSDYAEVNYFVSYDDGGMVCEVPSEVEYDGEIYPVTGVCYDGTPFVVGDGYAIEIILPETVTEFTYYEYSNRYYGNDFEHLQKITVHPNNEVYCDVDGVLFNKDKTALLFYPCARGESDFTIPKQMRVIDRYSMFFSTPYLQNVLVEEGNGRYSANDGVLYTADGEELLYYPINKQNETFTVPKVMQAINISSMLWSNSYLKNIEVDSENVYYKSVDNVLYSYDGSELVYRLANEIDYFAIPSTVNVVSYNALLNVNYLYVPKSVTLFMDSFVRSDFPVTQIANVYFESDALPNYSVKSDFQGSLYFGKTLEEFQAAVSSRS